MKPQTQLIWKSDGWAEKFGFELPEIEQSPPRAWVETTSIPLDTAHAYAAAINDAFAVYFDALTGEDLERPVSGTPPIYDTIGKVLAVFINWHIAAHAGEIAVLKGIQNQIGYGF